MPRCQALTKKGKGDRCTIEDAVWSVEDEGFRCHVHHPKLLFQMQEKARQLERHAKRDVEKKFRRPRKQKVQPDPQWLAAPPLKF